MSKQALIEQDDRWNRSEKKNITFDIVDENEAPIDVSAFELAWVMEELHDAAGDLLSKASGGEGITVGDGAATGDRVTVAVDSADTLDLEARVYRQALWRTDTEDPQLLAFGAAMLQAAAQVDVVSS